LQSESDNRNCQESESDDGTSDSTALVLTHILIRIQCWLDLYKVQPLHFWQ